MGHVLLDDGGHPDGRMGVTKVNLMATPYDLSESVIASRRITEAQAKDMLSKRPNLLSKP